MRATELTKTGHGTQFVLVFDRGDEVVEQLTAWCEEHRITAARLTGIGGFSTATVAWFGRGWGACFGPFWAYPTLLAAS